MRKSRRNFTGAEKMALLREQLIEKVPISEVCGEYVALKKQLAAVQLHSGLARKR